MIKVLTTAAVVLALLGVTGCSGDDGQDPEATSAPTAAAPPAAPKAHACYRLPFNAVLEPSNHAQPVPCSRPHTARTLYVGRIDPLVDGHLLAIDSDRVQKQVADGCRARAAAHLGGSTETQQLARLRGAWFSPTLTQSDAGALWFRCDLVLVAGPTSLANLPRRTAGILGRPGALDRFGTCGTASPADKRFRRVVCSRPHTWRARAILDIPADAKYLGRAARKDADARCRDVDARAARDSLKLRWSFEWPTREQWDTGQRYGYCWTPDPA